MIKKIKYPKQITINISDELFDEISQIAEDKEHSLSHTARRIVADAVRERKHSSFKDDMITKEG